MTSALLGGVSALQVIAQLCASCTLAAALKLTAVKQPCASYPSQMAECVCFGSDQLRKSLVEELLPFDFLPDLKLDK